jgi:hypothetical protein
VGITDLRIAGLGIWSVLPIIIGLALVVVGGTLAANGQPLGCLVGLSAGMGAMAVGLINKDDR